MLPLLNAPGAVGFPSLSFSWFSQSIFKDLLRERGGKREEERADREVEGETGMTVIKREEREREREKRSERQRREDRKSTRLNSSHL